MLRQYWKTHRHPVWVFSISTPRGLSLSQSIHEAPTTPIWRGRSELVERLLAQECELCGETNNIEVHQICKLADLERYGQANSPQWVKQMANRRRKTLVVCCSCHHDIQYGRYEGLKLST